MPKLWRVFSHDSTRIAELQRSAGLSAVVAQLLICRGISDPQAARDFLDVRLTNLRDPELLPGAVGAAERLTSAIRDGRRIVVYGDYDADGMTASAILFSCLKMLGAHVSYHVPCRLDDGYGLHCEALRTLKDRGADVVVSVDCGIASVEQARTAREIGLELIITDHHEFGETLPDAAAIVHPRLPGGDYPFAGLCGAGVAFKLAWLLCQQAAQSKKVSPQMRDFLLQAVGLAALGTVADCVPLVDENRIIVRHGLVSLRQRPTIGMAALLKLTGFDQKAELSTEDIGFTIAPRLNAAGRLGQATLAVELLTTESAERASALAEYLNELNGSRDSLERSVYLAANKQAQEQFDPVGDSALVLAERGWHPGVIGIVAGRLAEKFHRPVVLIALDELGTKPSVGSARSITGFDLHAALQACSDYLVGHGGHAAAAGLKLDETRLDEFRAAFCEHAASEICDEQRIAELCIDAEVPLSTLTLPVVQQLESLAPFGHGNSRPVLCASEVRLCEPPRKIGGGERHLALRVAQHGIEMRAVAFGGGEWAESIAQAGENLAVAFRPIINEFRGRRTVELQICDWHATAVANCQ